MLSSLSLALALACAAAAAAAAAAVPQPQPQSAAAEQAQAQAPPQYTVSGLSAGAYMAVQHHVAHSSRVAGCGAAAGGPFWCANDNVAVALGACMAHPDLIALPELFAATAAAAAVDSVDGVSHLGRAGVYLLSGRDDTVVDQGVVRKLAAYYAYYQSEGGGGGAVATQFELPMEHALPTLRFGNACGVLGEPFLADCGFDGAGAILQHVYTVARAGGAAAMREQEKQKETQEMMQKQKQDSLVVAAEPTGVLAAPGAALRNATAALAAKYVVALKTADYLPSLVPTPGTISMGDQAYAFVPPRCKDAATRANCTLHVAYHGCEQTVNRIGMTFVTHAGYLPWAFANDIVVLFPQVVEKDLPYNPKGCWDWWGYTGPDYATKIAPQMLTVNAMVADVQTKYAPASVTSPTR